VNLDAVCTTKPFGTCMLNLTQFDPTMNTTSFCCPTGFQCVMLGPVYGMCVPDFFSGSAAALQLTAGMAAEVETKVSDGVAPVPVTKHTATPISAQAAVPEVVAAPEVASPEAAPEVAAPEVCPTKPFGQCGGMNFSQPKLERKVGYNFTTAAEPYACCPAGFNCVSFGPVWAQCMPSWSAVASIP